MLALDRFQNVTLAQSLIHRSRFVGFLTVAVHRRAWHREQRNRSSINASGNSHPAIRANV